MCKRTTHLRSVIGFFIFFLSFGVFSQDIVLNAPELDVGVDPTVEPITLCASNDFFSFPFKFSFSGAAFNTNNDFIIELSDDTGDFTNAINVRTLFDNSYNSAFVVEDVTFDIPEGTFGDGYRIRIRSTDPEITTEGSIPFAAYYEPDFNIKIGSENSSGQEVTAICNGEPITLSVTGLENSIGNIETDNINDYEYAWYLDNNIINGETGATLTVSQSGIYYASFYLGEECTGSASLSGVINITASEAEDVFIEGNSTVELCSNETYDLVSSIDNTDYIYIWYKDDVPIDTGVDYLPVLTTPETDQYGVYRLELDTQEGCVVESQEVTIQPQDGAGFTITIDSDSRRVILPTETIVLNVEVDPTSTSLSYKWFKNDVELSNTQSEIQIIDAGEYFVEVTDNSSTCTVALNSDIYTFLDPVSLVPTIRTSEDYDECNSITTTLSIVGVNAIATDGEEYTLSSDQLELSSFNYQWFKDDVANGVLEDLDVTSYLENGLYYLRTTVGGGSSLVTGDSNSINVLLAPGTEITSSSESNKLCSGSVINLSINVLTGFTYTWFKDDEELTVDDPSNIDISEIGVYYVTYDGFGCFGETDRIEILEFDDDALELDPSTTAVLIPGETITLSATGADNYEWYNEDGLLLSTNETVDVSAIGTYILIGTVGDCPVRKEIQVVEDDGSFIIPNVITPFNSDGVNDTWQIPNKFAFQDDVTVIIYNSRGKELVKTTDYQNNWPEDNNFKAGMLFYFKVLKEDVLIKAGTISVLE